MNKNNKQAWETPLLEVLVRADEIDMKIPSACKATWEWIEGAPQQEFASCRYEPHEGIWECANCESLTAS